MRYLLPVVACAAAFTAGAVPALAKSSPEHHPRPERVASHVSLHLSRHAVLKGEEVTVRGRVRPSGRHRVRLAFAGAGGHEVGVWTKANGAFTVNWTAARTGKVRVRAFGLHDRRVRGSRSAVRLLTAYREAGASYYGPGLYGDGVACGGTLEPGTLGVANKTLPCGTEVTLRYRGHTVTVPVIDRGPYVAGRDYDLTTATKDRLHFPGVGTVLSTR